MPPRRRNTRRAPTEVVTFTHPDDSRRNIPTAEMEPVLDDEQRSPIRLAYERRNRDLDPQMVWKGKDEQDADGFLYVAAPPLFTQEKVHPKVLVDDLVRLSKKSEVVEQPTLDLFADFNGLPEGADRTDFYQHDGYWSNRMILGDSLQVMASLAEREGLQGKVQCIYIDPPYGIRFNSNFQWSTTSRDVRDGNVGHITREPEQVKAFRDTWRDGIHSYLAYLRDRLTVARDLLADSGSVFVQIGDENVHRVRALMDEVFGEQNFVACIVITKTTSATSLYMAGTCDYILWSAKNYHSLKYRQPFREKKPGETGAASYTRIQSPDGNIVRAMTRNEDFERDFEEDGWFLVTSDNFLSQSGGPTTQQPFSFQGESYRPSSGGWKTNAEGIRRLISASRITKGGRAPRYVRRINDFPVSPIANVWDDMLTGSFTEDKLYVVQTAEKMIQRCILMTTDPGDLVLDPTCGSGTTAYVAEQWGRRWITIDTSRVALALARTRIMGARYPYYLLADSPEGQRKEAEIRRRQITEAPTYGNVRQGFVYERVPHITLRDIANNAEIDVIWDNYQQTLEPLREELNTTLGKAWQEWEIPRDAGDDWTDEAAKLHQQWWEQRIARQQEIDASIAANADFEYLYDQPYTNNRKVRVAGPFTVESLSPHRVMVADDGEQGSGIAETGDGYRYDGDVPERDFAGMILDNLRTSGVQQAQRTDKIDFSSLAGWPGLYVCAEGRFTEGDDDAAVERRAAIFIGPEFGTVLRADLTAAAREAAEAGFDLLIACAFSYDAHATELTRIGALPVLKARMNADLHMADALRNDSRGNLFVIFGEPDIELQETDDDMVRVQIRGVDIFNPATGEVRSDETDDIACWFVDTDYNEESFFVRQAYFLGASSDPYRALKTTLRAEIDADAWATLNSDVSRPFPKPQSGRIAIKVINHLGDEAMKVLTIRG